MTELHHPAIERAPPQSMPAVVITKPGGPDVLQLSDVARPVPSPRQIRVRVHATAVNRADLLQRAGNYPVPADAPQDIPGLEYAGIVDALGEDVTRWSPGDRVMGLVGGGAYAHYIVTHEDETVRIPDRLGFEAAAAIPEAFITAHDAIVTQMNLRSGETLLIHAVASGVGTAALQLARQIGARVFGTQRSAWKLERAAALGLTDAIDVTRADFADVLLAATNGHGADGILDLVGGAYLAGNLKAAALLGRIMVVGLVAGATAELDMRTLLRKRLTVRGTVLRARNHEEKVAATRAFERDVLPLLADGSVSPIVDAILPLADARRAHEMVGHNSNFGKVVLSMR
jgi:NADPH:quinone reductase